MSECLHVLSGLVLLVIAESDSTQSQLERKTIGTTEGQQKEKRRKPLNGKEYIEMKAASAGAASKNRTRTQRK